MTELRDLEVVWSVLETQAPTAADVLKVSGTGADLGGEEILVGSSPEGLRHLLLPLPPGAAFAPETGTKGIHVTRRQLDTGAGVREFVDVECRLKHLNSVFATLAREMLDAAVDSPAQPAAACRVVLDRWREFLGQERASVLSDAKLVGLLAELHVLRDVLRYDNALRLDAWVGPSGAAHDFRRGSLAVEVKGTRVREGKFVEVHGIEQLVPPPGGSLHLAWLRLEADDVGPISVPAITRELQEMGVDMLDLHQRLAQVGYDATYADAYEPRRYRLVESRTYEVGGGFPRLVPETMADGAVPAGVIRLRYVVDLTNEPPSPLGMAEAASIYGALATA